MDVNSLSATPESLSLFSIFVVGFADFESSCSLLTQF